MKKLNIEKARENILRRAEADMADGRLACADIIVKQHGGDELRLLIDNSAYGGSKLKENSIFRIASMTKATTAAAVMQQVEKGRIDMNAPVSEYIPEFAHLRLGHVENGIPVYAGEAKETLRVFHLLTHTNGIDVGAMNEALIGNHPRKTLTETALYYAKSPLTFEPYTATGYSESAGFDIAARIVELVSGEEYGAYVKENIFAPLGMKDTTFAPDEEQWKRIVPMHCRTAEGKSAVYDMVPGCVYDDLPVTCCLAGGGLASTSSDYIRFADMLLNGGISDEGVRVLAESSVREMSSPHVPDSIMSGLERWGYGMRVIVKDGNPNGLPKGTFGWSGAYGTHFWVDPVNMITAVYMRNSQYDSHGCGSIGSIFEKDVCDALE